MNASRSNRLQPTAADSGFTLIETLVCLALSVLLFGAIYEASHQQWKLRTAGGEQVRVTLEQVGIVDRIQRDLQRVKLVPSFDSSLRGHATFQTGIQFELTRIEERVLDLDQSQSAEPLGFYGTSSLFAFSISAPEAERSPFPGQQQVVAYGITRGGHLQLPAQRKQTRVQFAGSRSAAATGLCRATVVPGMTAADSTSRDRAVQTQFLSDRVAQMSVRYFDGSQWFSDWDRDGGRTWPVSLQITLWFNESRNGEPADLRPQSFVVSLPVDQVVSQQSAGGRS